MTTTEKLLKLEIEKYKLMTLEDVNPNMKDSWNCWIKDNYKNQLGLRKIKIISIAMRRLTNAFSCEEVIKFYNSFGLDDDSVNDIEEKIIEYHALRGEELKQNIIKKSDKK